MRALDLLRDSVSEDKKGGKMTAEDTEPLFDLYISVSKPT